MRKAIMVLMIMAIAGTAIAVDLGNTRDVPVKNTPHQSYDPPAVPKQGGDTIFDATPIAGLPYTDQGTTVGYAHDYDEICPYSGSLSPDVVYSFTPAANMIAVVDLLGSTYDTKVYVYDESLNMIACNDDFYSDYVSKIEQVALNGGMGYFIVVDGYGSDSGDYVITVTEYEQCFVYCPADAVPEGEPPLSDGYADAHNGGCNSPEFGNPFQYIDWINVEDGSPIDGQAWMCGVSGWYIGASGGETRDTDWFSVFALETGMINFTVESEFPCYMFTLAPTDCANTGVVLDAAPSCGDPQTLSFAVNAGMEYWLWVGPQAFTGPVNEFNYFMTVDNNMFNVVPTEDMSWGGVKSLYR